VIRDGALALSAAVMTHPSREAEVRRFVERHPELDLRVAVDPRPGRGHSLGTALLAWSMAEPGATHHLVLQDDVLLCEGFVELTFAAVRTHPDAAVSMFAEWGARAGGLVRLALLRGQGYAAVADPYIPTQALVLPAALAADFAEKGRAETEPDDIALLRHLRRTGTPAVVVAPNLVQHEDRPSLTGNTFQGPRLSACFVPDPTAAAPAALEPTVAGADLDFLPHASWMRLVGEWFYCGPDEEAVWTGWPLADRFPPGLDTARLRAQYAAQLARIDTREEIRSALSDTVLFEVWLTCFALGLVGGVAPAGVEARAADPLWRAALATVLPGAFRRYLPAPVLDRLGPYASDLFGLAVHAGAETAAGLDRDTLLGIAHRGARRP
jgi:hypothetical protein